MPWKGKVACGHPGCPELIPAGTKYCAKHSGLHKDGERISSSRRGYDRKWRAFRKRYLKAHPLCVECMKEGKYVAATDVDHIKTIRDHPELKYDLRNLQALCHSCHSRKTNREDLHPTYRY